MSATIPFFSLGGADRCYNQVYADYMERRTIVLYGQSMLLTLVAASISQSERLRVIQAESWQEVEALADDCPPDVLIYDLTGATEGLILMLLNRNPRLQLIGLDAEANRAVLITGRETCSLTLDLIKEIVQGSPSIDSA